MGHRVCCKNGTFSLGTVLLTFYNSTLSPAWAQPHASLPGPPRPGVAEIRKSGIGVATKPESALQLPRYFGLQAARAWGCRLTAGGGVDAIGRHPPRQATRSNILQNFGGRAPGGTGGPSLVMLEGREGNPL